MTRHRRFGSVYVRRSRGTGGIAGVWYIKYRERGREVRKKIGPERSHAEAALAKIEWDRAKEKHLGITLVGAITLADFWPTLEPVLRARHGATTFAAETPRYRVMETYFGTRPLKEIGPAHVEDFLAHLRHARGCSPATQNRYLALLSVTLTQAVARKFADENVVRRVTRGREETKPVPYLAPDDLARLATCAPPDLEPVIVLAAETGLRRGELAALDWGDVDLARGTLLVRHSKNRRPRQVPLTPRAAAALRDLDTRRLEAQFLGPPAPDAPRLRRRAAAGPDDRADPVFPALAGTGKDAVTRRFPAVAKAAKLPGLRFHDLRHAFASGLVRAGVPIPMVGTLLGHAQGSIGVTMRYARHAPDGAEFDAIRRLAAARGQLGTPATAPGIPPASAPQVEDPRGDPRNGAGPEPRHNPGQ